MIPRAGAEIVRASDNKEADITLIVVDAQFGFEAARPVWFIKAVEEQILIAMRNHWPIVVVEMTGFGSTFAVLMDRLQGKYDRFVLKRRLPDDASQEILFACEERDFTTKRFRLCGVNSEACVLATADGLRRKFPGSLIEIATGACNSGSGWNVWHEFPNYPEFVLLPPGEPIENVPRPF